MPVLYIQIIKTNVCENLINYRWTIALLHISAVIQCSDLVVDAAVLYFMRTRNVVAVLTESWVLPVVHSLARRRTNVRASWDTQRSWCEVVQCVVGWRHPTQEVTRLRFHPAIIGRLPWPRGAGHQHEETKIATCCLETHVDLTDFLSELGFWK